VAGVTGVQAHPQNFCLSKIQEKILKIWAKSMKILAKNGTQRCLNSKNGAQHLQKNT